MSQLCHCHTMYMTSAQGHEVNEKDTSCHVTCHGVRSKKSHKYMTTGHYIFKLGKITDEDSKAIHRLLLGCWPNRREVEYGEFSAYLMQKDRSKTSSNRRTVQSENKQE